MKISLEGLDLIKKWEGLVLEAYIPLPGDVPTIGYGSTGEHVKMGDVISVSEAEELLLDDLVRFEICVNRRICVKITQDQYDACLSFAFNLGCKSFRQSTLLKRINTKRIKEAANQFKRWNKVNGVEILGLTNRREDERKLFLRSRV